MRLAKGACGNRDIRRHTKLLFALVARHLGRRASRLLRLLRRTVRLRVLAAAVWLCTLWRTELRLLRRTVRLRLLDAAVWLRTLRRGVRLLRRTVRLSLLRRWRCGGHRPNDHLALELAGIRDF